MNEKQNQERIKELRRLERGRIWEELLKYDKEKQEHEEWLASLPDSDPRKPIIYPYPHPPMEGYTIPPKTKT